MGKPDVNFESYWQICCNCGMHFGVPDDFDDRRRKNHQTFYCPNGHPQSYQGKTTEQKLREENERLKSKADRLKDTLNYTELSRRAARGQITKIKNRISKGICPCCSRSFENLKGHMETKHPGWNE